MPSDWKVDLADLRRSIRRGRLPHLTWGRAVAGGAVAFVALFLVAGLLVVLNGDRGGLGPRELRAEGAAPGLAVLPFSTSGSELDAWREGLVDLLSRNLDGLGAIRAIDSRTVLARWRESVPDEAAPDLATTLAVAQRTGALWAVVGSAVEVGSRVRVSADLYEVESGRRVDQATVEGSPDSLLAIVDELSVEVARALLSREDADLTNLNLASITTASPAALRAFLEGEASYRRSQFPPAIEAYERAVALDSLFALAHFRLGSARGWMGEENAPEARRVAYERRERLPAREALMVEADYLARSGGLPAGVALLREGVRRYPDHAELWYQLGDIYLHSGSQLLLREADAERALLKAVELDPGFAPYQIHVVDLALLRGDSAEAARRLEAERAASGSRTRTVQAHTAAPRGDAAAVLAAPQPGSLPLTNPAFFLGGVLALEQGRPALADSAVRLLSQAADARAAGGDTLAAGIIRGLAEGVGAYAALVEGRTEVARTRLERARDLLAGSAGPEGALRTFLIWPLAELYAAEGRHEDALRHFEALREGFHAGPAVLRRAEIHEGMGDAERGAALRREFLTLWSAADPDHPLVRRARRGLPPD